MVQISVIVWWCEECKGARLCKSASCRIQLVKAWYGLFGVHCCLKRRTISCPSASHLFQTKLNMVSIRGWRNESAREDAIRTKTLGFLVLLGLLGHKIAMLKLKGLWDARAIDRDALYRAHCCFDREIAVCVRAAAWSECELYRKRRHVETTCLKSERSAWTRLCTGPSWVMISDDVVLSCSRLFEAACVRSADKRLSNKITILDDGNSVNRVRRCAERWYDSTADIEQQKPKAGRRNVYINLDLVSYQMNLPLHYPPFLPLIPIQ